MNLSQMESMLMVSDWITKFFNKITPSFSEEAGNTEIFMKPEIDLSGKFNFCIYAKRKERPQYKIGVIHITYLGKVLLMPSKEMSLYLFARGLSVKSVYETTEDYEKFLIKCLNYI